MPSPLFCHSVEVVSRIYSMLSPLLCDPISNPDLGHCLSNISLKLAKDNVFCIQDQNFQRYQKFVGL